MDPSKSNGHNDWNTLKGIQVWNGIPSHNFRRIWWLHLVVALGAVVQEGNTLLQTARGQDEGRPGTAATVLTAVGAETADQLAVRQSREDEKFLRKQEAHAIRVHRLAACILNYINPRSGIFHLFSRAPFQNAGIAIYNYLYEYGHLERDHDSTQELLKEWEEATLLIW